jgi:hypothetical protein
MRVRSATNPTLAKWLSRQRGEWRAGTLSPARVEQLAALGVTDAWACLGGRQRAGG